MLTDADGCPFSRPYDLLKRSHHAHIVVQNMSYCEFTSYQPILDRDMASTTKKLLCDICHVLVDT